MKREWQTKKLGDLCDVIGGGTPPKDKPAYYSGDIPWATVRDMRQDVITETEFRITKDAVKSSATNIIPSGNVVIATRVGLGKVCLLGQDTAINQDLRAIVPHSDKSLLVRYLYWWLKSVADVIVAEGTGATVQGVKLPFVKSLQIPVPPLAEQQRIVSLLDEAFEGIATAKANAEKNLQNARALFESHLQSVFSQHSPGWDEMQLSALYKIGSSKRVLKSEWKSDGVPFYRGREVTRLAADGFVDNELFISEEHFAALSNEYGVPEAGDIVITAIGTIGNAHVVQSSDRFYFKDASVLWMKRTADVCSEFIRFWLKSSLFFDQLDRGNGATVDTLTIQKLQSVELRLPQLEEQMKIVTKLKALTEETQRLARIYEQKLAALEALKKSLLHKAFAGEL